MKELFHSGKKMSVGISPGLIHWLQTSPSKAWPLAHASCMWLLAFCFFSTTTASHSSSKEEEKAEFGERTRLISHINKESGNKNLTSAPNIVESSKGRSMMQMKVRSTKTEVSAIQTQET